MKQLSGVSRSFEGHPRSFQGHLRSFLMIFHLLFTHTWVYKFNSLISQKSCKNDLVSEYVYISIYIYIFLNGILTFVHSRYFFSKILFITFGPIDHANMLRLVSHGNHWILPTLLNPLIYTFACLSLILFEIIEKPCSRVQYFMYFNYNKIQQININH